VTVLPPSPDGLRGSFRTHASSNVRFAERQAPATRVPCGVPESGRVDVPALHRPENLKLVAFEPDVVGASGAGIMLRRVALSLIPPPGGRILRDQCLMSAPRRNARLLTRPEKRWSADQGWRHDLDDFG